MHRVHPFIYHDSLVTTVAKRKPKRRMGRYLKGRVNEELALGTLAAKTLVGTTFDETVVDRTLVSSLKATWTMREYTPAEGDGPIVFGVAHGDYSDAEIEEVIENTGSWNEGDKIAQEQSKRLVRTIGVFDTAPSAAGIYTINDGMPVHTKLNWILNQGVRLKIWAYNQGSSALATTSPVISAEGHANLFPK